MRSTILLALALSCAGPKELVRPADKGPIAVAGARCTGGACVCRRVDDRYQSLEPQETEEGVPAAGTKRFEIRTGRGLDPLAIAVEGRGTLTRRSESVEPSCAYVDLPPGKHRVWVRAQAQNPEAGQVPSFFISEYSASQQSWYDTFRFRCGGDEVCMQGHMDQWLKMVQGTPRGLFDPCGSTRVEGVRWTAASSVGPKLADLEVELTLHVYQFPPRFKHGVPTCKGPSQP